MSDTRLEQAVTRRIESFQPSSAPGFDEVLSRHRAAVRRRRASIAATLMIAALVTVLITFPRGAGVSTTTALPAGSPDVSREPSTSSSASASVPPPAPAAPSWRREYGPTDVRPLSILALRLLRSRDVRISVVDDQAVRPAVSRENAVERARSVVGDDRVVRTEAALADVEEPGRPARRVWVVALDPASETKRLLTVDPDDGTAADWRSLPYRLTGLGADMAHIEADQDAVGRVAASLGIDHEGGDVPPGAGHLANDPRGLRVLVWWKGEPPGRVQRRLGMDGDGVRVVLFPAAYSLAELRAAQDRVFAASRRGDLPRVTMSGDHPGIEGIQVGVDPAAVSGRSLVELTAKFEAVARVPVTLEATQGPVPAGPDAVQPGTPLQVRPASPTP